MQVKWEQTRGMCRMNKVDENSRKYKFLNYRGAISGVDIYLYFLLLCSESCSFVRRLLGDISLSIPDIRAISNFSTATSWSKFRNVLWIVTVSLHRMVFISFVSFAYWRSPITSCIIPIICSRFLKYFGIHLANFQVLLSRGNSNG